MQIPPSPSLRVEDFPGQKEWIGTLLLPLNQILSGLTSAMGGNVTFGDNVPCQTQTLSFTYSGSSDFPKTFKCSLASPPLELRVVKATEDGTPIIIMPAWSYSNGQVSISEMARISEGAVSALVSGSIYQIVLRVQP